MPDSGLRAIDLRFLLPELPAKVRLVGEPPGWRDGLAAAGISVVDGAAPLTVAAVGRGAEAARCGSASVLLLGRRGARVLRRHGYATRVVLVRPRLFVPLDAAAACAHALLAPHPHRSALRRLAARLALAALRLGLPVAPTAIVALRGGRQRPALLDAAAGIGARVGDDWCVLRGGGDDLQRLVWLCFDGRDPSTAVKWTRLPGNAGPFDRDASAGETLAALPAELSTHAVRHLGRFHVGGFDAVAESAAPGVPLQDALEVGSGAPGAIDAVARWIVELGTATRRPPVDADHRVDGVFQHTDLGTWNVLVDGDGFTVVDWESSRDGLPLWDLAYFLSDALTAHGPRDPDARVEAMLALHRGEADASERFFQWIEHGAEAAEVPRESIGNVILLGWLHHGRSQEERADRGRALEGETLDPGYRGPLERLAGPWVTDPALGAGWPAFAQWREAHGAG